MVSYSKFIAIFASLLFLASGFAYVATDTGGGVTEGRFKLFRSLVKQ
jgi:hypothetical protein